AARGGVTAPGGARAADRETAGAPGGAPPFRLSSPLPADTPASVLKPHAAPAAAPSPLRILLVDDDPLVLKSLRDTLEVDGHSVRVANGGQAGIDLFLEAHTKGAPFDVVITDFGIPYLDGRKVPTSIKSPRPAARATRST